MRVRFPEISVTSFALGVSALWLLACNHRFWSGIATELWSADAASMLFVASVFGIIWVLQATVLMLMPGRIAPRIAAGTLSVIAAAGAYFTDSFGTLLNRDMIRNVFQTDASEASDLLTVKLVIYIALLGVLPALLVWRVPLRRTSWQRETLQRVGTIAAGFAVFGLGAWLASASWASFLREHKPLRYTVNPLAAVASTAGYLAASNEAPLQLEDPGGEPSRATPARAQLATVGLAPRKPLLLFLVIGETARAANWQLNGYARPTTPQLALQPDVFYFRDTASCGTSTSASVPCMFSHLGRAGFRGTESRRYTNLLDMLVRAGIDVEWRDNNSGCKGVCSRVTTMSYDDGPQRAADLCEQAHCYDEIMNADLEARIAHIERDTLIVFHQNGSHGPAYYERYPQAREFFTPACHSKELDRCTAAEVVNAYDNSLRYTDYVLARQMEILQRAADHVQGALLYVSDHGESLGEGGLHLHGMPYAIAPAAQKQVPLLLWTSREYLAAAHTSASCLAERAARGGASHDDLFSTVMGLLGVRNAVYRSAADLTASCRQRNLQAAREVRSPT